MFISCVIQLRLLPYELTYNIDFTINVGLNKRGTGIPNMTKNVDLKAKKSLDCFENFKKKSDYLGLENSKMCLRSVLVIFRFSEQ